MLVDTKLTNQTVSNITEIACLLGTIMSLISYQWHYSKVVWLSWTVGLILCPWLTSSSSSREMLKRDCAALSLVRVCTMFPRLNQLNTLITLLDTRLASLIKLSAWRISILVLRSEIGLIVGPKTATLFSPTYYPSLKPLVILVTSAAKIIVYKTLVKFCRQVSSELDDQTSLTLNISPVISEGMRELGWV